MNEKKEMVDSICMMNGFLTALRQPLEERLIKKTELPFGFIVSTIDCVFDPLIGFETAIVDANGVHPVERYKTREEAITGHEKWVVHLTKCESEKISIDVLGYGSLVEKKLVTLKRRETSD